MTDIVERLRNSGPIPSIFAVRDAADEIERLRAALGQPVPLSEWQKLVAERDALRALLRELRHSWARVYGLSPKGRECLAKIDAALGKEKP